MTILILFILLPSDAEEALETVDLFYRLEQEADFSTSWELFHSEMKNRFPKAGYIQDRAHVFMNHFGVNTYTYTLSEPEEIEDWKMDIDTESIFVYEIIVTQSYIGKYGRFDFIQYVYVSLEEDEWKILWDYNE
ncbi:hypothetical protein [Jeotgalibacillus soli]|nr:hypothetical protein [Jeotgalibacillus soli]